MYLNKTFLLCRTWRHIGSEDISPLLLNLSASTMSTLLPRKQCSHSLNRRLRGTQGLCRSCWEQKNLLLLPGNKPRSLWCPARTPVAIYRPILLQVNRLFWVRFPYSPNVNQRRKTSHTVLNSDLDIHRLRKFEEILIGGATQLEPWKVFHKAISVIKIHLEVK